MLTRTDLSFNEWLIHLQEELMDATLYIETLLNQKNNKKLKDFFTGKDEIELTDELIDIIVKEKKWGDKQSLIELRQQGAKWNIKRNSLVVHLFLIKTGHFKSIFTIKNNNNDNKQNTICSDGGKADRCYSGR
jgi:hypothetical protein